MNILMVCREHPIHFNGGLSIAAWNTARAATDAGNKVTFITGEHPDGKTRETLQDGVTVLWLKGIASSAAGYAKLYKWLPQNYSKLNKKYGPFDVVHSQSSGATPLINLDPHVPIVFQDHGTQYASMQDEMNINAFGIKYAPQYKNKHTELYDEFTNFIEGKEIDYLRKFDAVLATSSISAWDLKTRYFLTNVHKLYHCIYDLVPEIRPAHEKPVVGFFSCSLDTPHKSVMFGLKALLPIKDKIKVKMIGKGGASTKFAKENFKDCVVTGFLPEDKAVDELAEVDVLFECSCHHRGINMAGITAIGVGVPVLMFPTGGHIDLVGLVDEDDTRGQAGAIVDPFDGGAIISELEHIIANRRRYSAGAAKLFERRFSPEACGRAITKIYKSIAKEQTYVINPGVTPLEPTVETDRKSLTIVIPSGIGDNTWIYCKLAQLGIPLNMIAVESGDKNRTHQIMELFPLVKSLKYSDKYTYVMLKKEGIPSNMTSRELLMMPDPIMMECNIHLEEHKHLNNWIPDLPVQYHPTINLIPEHVAVGRDLVHGSGYLCVSPASTSVSERWPGAWEVDSWFKFIKLFMKDIRKTSVVIIGAKWDISMSAQLAELLQEEGIPVIDTTAKLELSATIDVIRRSCYFAGFSSGLQITAALFSHPTLMLYSHTIGGVMGTFADPDIIKDGTFTETLWDTPENIIDIVRTRALNKLK